MWIPRKGPPGREFELNKKRRDARASRRFLLLGGVVVLMVVGGLFPIWRWPARLGPQPSRWRQAVSWRLCRLETARALRALRRLTDGACILRVKPLFLLWESGVFYLAVVFFACPAGDCFSACPAGAKTTFSFACKRKSGSGLRKRKGRPVEILARCGTTG